MTYRRRYRIVKDRKRVSKQKCTDSYYRFQESKDVPHISVKMSCAKTQFPALWLYGPHAKPHGVIGLIKHFHLQLDPKLIHGKCAIQKITCSCIWLVPAQDVHFFYTRSHLSALQNFALLFSVNFQFIFIFKKCITQFSHWIVSCTIFSKILYRCLLNSCTVL